MRNFHFSKMLLDEFLKLFYFLYFFIVINIIVDMLYILIDPRIRTV